MIFVTVGNSNIGFERLIRAMDALAPKLPYEVIMQIGSSSYIPKNARWFRYADYETMLEHFKNAKVIVTHAGAGTILDILMLGKKPIVVPRLKKFGEHIDDHQLEIVRALEERGLVIPVYDIQKLGEAILDALDSNLKARPRRKTPPRLVRIIAELVNNVGGI
ncbi:beta-1,4-galactosyltransferase [Thermococcus aggregans]|uniref:Beta-1,4-galactosyltransferase n=1 Tax=Thermococcus aggregans TaxID=110163 RepID=A0A9E7MYA9_THEAG|nr:PssE/Cps14G family polysaccharide biosynthesis glycosyltransferase [Thermococcus aggregans]USS41057.1 beta-1,4-galactosyltransferase [Thermococcus aggregans]